MAIPIITMSKNQTTALLLLAFTAFLFWLYNTGKLKPIIATIKGSTNTAAQTAIQPISTILPMPVISNNGLTTQPYNGSYQLPTIQGSNYIQPTDNNGVSTLNNIKLSQSLYSIPTTDPGVTPEQNIGLPLGIYDALSSLGWV